MRIPGFIISAFMVISFAGCTVGPDYKPPKMSAPGNFVLQDVLESIYDGQSGAEEQSTVPVNWWEGFSDPILNSLVEKGLVNNYNIRIAAARLKASEAGLRLAAAGNKPVTTASGVPNLELEKNLEGDDTDFNSGFLGSLGVVLPLDIFGQVERQKESARALVESATAEMRGTILRISSDIANQYLRLRGDQRQLALLEQSVSLQEKTLSIVKSRYNAGLSPELDVRRAEASVETLRADIPPLQEALVNTRNNLATLTGKYPGAYEELLSDEKDIPDYKGNVPDLVPVGVLSLRPDVQQAEAELKSSVARIGVAEAEYYPFFNLAAGISVGSAGLTAERMVNTIVGSIRALIEQVISDGGERKANVDIAKANAEESLARYRQTLAALDSSMKKQRSLEKAVNASERSFHQAEILYAQGLTSFLDVVDAQRVLASAQQQLASARTGYATQVATLFRVLGTEIKYMDEQVTKIKNQ